MLAFPASGRFGGALAGIWRYTVKFDIALALQLRSQNVLLIAEALSDIEDVTWKVIKVVSSKISTTLEKSRKLVFSVG